MHILKEIEEFVGRGIIQEKGGQLQICWKLN